MGYATLIVKGTRLCNLRCTYCHDWREGPGQQMAFEVLANLTIKALTESSHDAVTFIWHGGEPTLMPMSFYRKALVIQSRTRRSGQRVSNLLQTNAASMTPRWAAFFKQAEFSIGVSIDGPSQIHDRQRLDVKGRPTLERVLKGIQLLKEHDVKHSVLMVIDDRAYALGAEAIFRFFIDNGIERFGFLAEKPSNNDEPSNVGKTVTPKMNLPRFNRFLMRMHRLREAHGDPNIHIRELDVLSKRIAGSAERPCTLSGGCIGNYFVVEPNGDVGHCDLFLGDVNYTLGNILEHDFGYLKNNTAIERLRELDRQEVAERASCPEFNICSGGCPHDRYISSRHDATHETRCCGLSKLIQYIKENDKRSVLDTSVRIAVPGVPATS